ncbi:MAG TPA: LPS export ABC transporter periplasmic protein LptC [Bryobacteraceae bacterium]|nr:LPS export ABC transporter periplasmic protein LptC [Bryobacteraceae bacterium]
MRRTGWLILAAIPILVFFVGSTYFSRVSVQKQDAPKPPRPLLPGVDATGEGWHYRSQKGQKAVSEISAKSVRQITDPSKFELSDVELHLFHKDGEEYDRVKSAKADYDTASGMMFSDGQVEITMGVPADKPPAGQLLKIDSSGVTFDTKTGKATTDRPATFTFQKGDGKAVGADYDPQTHELHLHSQVELHWTGTSPSTKPMTIEGGEAIYKEQEAKVYLMPWSRLKRDTLMLDAGPATVTLQNSVIRLVETTNARGVQDDPGRKVEYAADQLRVELNEAGVITKIIGNQNAHLAETAETAQTTITCDRVDLDFTPSDKDSTLAKAIATGHTVVNSKPIARPGTLPAETRILKSETVELHMRPGGQEIGEVDTDTPGAVEFVPNRPEQAHRWMNGERIWIKYGPDNQIETFRSVNVTTRTENTSKTVTGPDGKPQPAPPALTVSHDLLAKFDPKTSQLAEMQQWGAFHYESGTRKAVADTAILDQTQNVITLEKHARVWDQTGSTSADKIVMNQKTGDFTADGNVSSTRMPDKQGASSAMLSNDEPMQAKAAKMISANKNLLIRYEGHAIAWQGANRVQADRIEIDRNNGTLQAHGHVISQLVDKAKDDSESGDSTKDPAGQSARQAKSTVGQKNTHDSKAGDAKSNSKGSATASQAPIFTLVRADNLVYTEDNRVADYTGGVVLNRPGMRVKAAEIRAFLNDSDSGSDSSLNHALADGAVEIVQTTPQRTRTGTSEHAEYYADDQKVILVKGAPQMVDSLKGSTHGKQLTYFANDDRLVVNGMESQPASSTIRHK